MNRRVSTVFLALPLALTCAAAQAEAPAPDRLEATVVRHVHATASTSLSVDDPSGTIVVYGAPGSDIVVTATLHASNPRVLHALEATVRREGDVVAVGTALHVDKAGAYSAVDLSIAVPASMPVVVTGGSARVTVHDLRAPLAVTTVTGSITVAGSHSMQLRSTTGPVAIRVAPGAQPTIRARSVTGNIMGALVATTSRTPDGTVMTRRGSASLVVDAQTETGSIVLDGASGG